MREREREREKRKDFQINLIGLNGERSVKEDGSKRGKKSTIEVQGILFFYI